jgi:hypothetical protein
MPYVTSRSAESSHGAIAPASRRRRHHSGEHRLVGSQPRAAALECVPVHVVGRREGGHVCGDRIRPLLEQRRQILVPYLP